MNFAQSVRGHYIAAFLLGALLALLLLAPARAAEPAPLDRIAVVRFTAGPDQTLLRQTAVLHDDGRLLPRVTTSIARPRNTPEWVLGRNLVSVDAWSAYYLLGYDALSRFELGAFALDERSTDAAALIELPPGAYTVVVQSASPNFRAGDVLLEIYTVPAI